jgi:hypothetical protein
MSKAGVNSKTKMSNSFSHLHDLSQPQHIQQMVLQMLRPLTNPLASDGTARSSINGGIYGLRSGSSRSTSLSGFANAEFKQTNTLTPFCGSCIDHEGSRLLQRAGTSFTTRSVRSPTTASTRCTRVNFSLMIA